MNLRIGQLSPHFFVSAQITPHDVTELAANGFKAIVNNRPDGEQPGQPTSDEIAAAAAGNGLEYVYLPVKSGGITAENLQDFHDKCAHLEGPVLMYCRSGARCAMLWQLAELD